MKEINEIKEKTYYEKYKALTNDYNRLFKEKVDLINLLINIDFQCFCARLKTPTIKHISKIIKEYQEKENER